MSKVHGGWLKASVYDPATGTTVQLNHLSTEFSEFTKTPIPSETSTGQTYGGAQCDLTIGFFDSDGISQLQTWMKDGTKLNAVVYGEQESVLWYEDVEIDFQRGVEPNAREGVTIHQVIMSYAGEQPEIASGQNLAYAYNKTQGFASAWQDSDGDGVADGWIASSLETTSFSAGVQTMASTDDTGLLILTFVFPISGVTLISSIDIVAVRDDNYVVGMEVEEFNGSTLFTDNNTTSGTGRKTSQLETPANSYYLTFRIYDANESFDIDIKDPAIRAAIGNKKDQYVDY